jgi:spermidine/putrescine-binding protein
MDAPGLPNQLSLSRRQVLRALSIGPFALGSLLSACASKDEAARLAFLNWNDYVAPDTISTYEKVFETSVSYQTYESNDELAKLLRQAGSARRGGRKGSTFDLAVPSGSVMGEFIRGGLLQKLDPKKLPSLDVFRPDVLTRPFDPKNEWSVPWATGTTGIGYDLDVFKSPPDWTVFADDTYKGRLTLLNEKQEAMSAALLSIGADPNSTDVAAINKAGDQLRKMLEVTRLDSSEAYWRNLADGTVVAVQGYSSDIAQARERAKAKGRNIGFVLPTQGSTRWVDNLVIPDGAPRPLRAHTFISHIMTPEVSAAIITSVKAATGNGAAQKLLTNEVLNDPMIFPPDAALKNSAFAADLGDAAADWTRVWKAVTGG